MINLEQLSVDLAYKIGDPVINWKTDGKLFTVEDRIMYINQGISKLYLYLANLKREYRPKFVDYLSTAELNLGDNDGNIYLDDPNTIYCREIKEIFVEYETELGNKTVKAEKIESEDFLSVQAGLNTLYKPDFKAGRVYWTLVENVIKLLPQSQTDEVYQKILLSYIKDISYFAPVRNTQGDFSNIAPSNWITQDYYLMILILSAMQAYLDLGNANKYQLLERELTGVLQLIGQVTQLEEAKDGK